MSFLNFFTGTAGYTAILGALGLAVAAHFFAPRAWSALAWTIAFGVLGAAFVGQREITATERAAHADTRAAHAETLRAIAQAAAETHQRVAAARDAWARDFAALDTRHHQELTHAQADNDRLRAAVRAGTASVRLKASVCPSALGAVPETTATGELEHAGTTLDAHVQQLVLDHRAAILGAERQIAYLQDYARQCAAVAVE